MLLGRASDNCRGLNKCANTMVPYSDDSYYYMQYTPQRYLKTMLAIDFRFRALSLSVYINIDIYLCIYIYICMYVFRYVMNIDIHTDVRIHSFIRCFCTYTFCVHRHCGINGDRRVPRSFSQVPLSAAAAAAHAADAAPGPQGWMAPSPGVGTQRVHVLL